MDKKPILFNTEMVRAILEGRKTVTRRVIKPRYRDDENGWAVCINSYTHYDFFNHVYPCNRSFEDIKKEVIKMEQMTIFDVVSVKDTDFRTLTIEEIVSVIENSTGLVFKRAEMPGSYKAIVKPKEFDIHLSRYTLNNEPFISCSYWNKKKLEGCGFPCDSLNEAIQFFRERK